MQIEASKASCYLMELDTIKAKINHVEKEKDRVWKAFELTGDEAKFIKEIKGIMARIEELQKRKV